jgi:glucose/arabinose dehydrogenase
MRRVLGVIGITALAAAALVAGVAAGTGNAVPTKQAATIPTITVTMRDFTFRLSRKTVPAEKVRLVFVNSGSVLHDWVVPGEKRLRSRELAPRRRQTLVVTLKQGLLHFLCDIPGHAKLGMKGVLAVGRAKPPRGGTPRPPAPPPVSGQVKLTSVATHLDRPVLVTSPPGATGEIEIVEQSGTIHRLVNGVEQTAPFLDVRDQVRLVNETGLLGLAFAPDYATSHRLYVDYNGHEGNGDLHIVEYRTYAANPALVDPESARELLHIVKPWENHNGGMLQFGPDGHLYISVGDGDAGVLHPPGTFAQTRDDLLADILRIDPEPGPAGAAYTVPAENPFVGESGARPEIWAYGLRNPWRFWIDPPTGTMVIGDVGLGAREELDVVPGPALAHGGENFGWPCFEGTVQQTFQTHCVDPVAPAFDYDHAGGRCGVIGGVVARDPAVPALLGRYLFADLCAGHVLSAALSDDGTLGTPGDTGLSLDSPTSFGVDGAGHVYVMTLGGDVDRFEAAVP